MDLLATTEGAQKMGHLIELRRAVARAREHHHKSKSHRSAVLLQRAMRDLAEFLATMPLRVVA